MTIPDRIHKFLIERARCRSAMTASLSMPTSPNGSRHSARATLDDFRGTEGEAGDFDRAFAVFAKAGLPCPKCRCRDGVKGIVQQGRSTFLCPEIQH
jgi:formamidopyrimidine-DNA glycosylase